MGASPYNTNVDSWPLPKYWVPVMSSYRNLPRCRVPALKMRRTKTEVRGTGIQLKYRYYRSIECQVLSSCRTHLEESDTGVEFIPNLPKCRANWYLLHTELIPKLPGTGIEVVPKCRVVLSSYRTNTQVSGTAVDLWTAALLSLGFFTAHLESGLDTFSQGVPLLSLLEFL